MIQNYVHPVEPALSSIKLKSLIQLQSPVMLPSNDIDSLLQTSWYFRNSSNYRPHWSDYMQNISKGYHPGLSKFIQLPIIDLNPTKESCINSTLLFVREQAPIFRYCYSLQNYFFLYLYFASQFTLQTERSSKIRIIAQNIDSSQWDSNRCGKLHDAIS